MTVSNIFTNIFAKDINLKNEFVEVRVEFLESGSYYALVIS